MMGRYLTPLAVLIAAIAVTWATRAPAETINKILATVDGEPITLHELKRFVQDDPRAQQLDGADSQLLLDAVIMDHIIDKEVSTLGIVVRDADVERYIDGIKQRNKLNDEQLRTALAQQGLTWEAYHQQVRKELQKVQLINQQIRGKVNVTPEEVERFYKANLTDYSLPEQVKISHIVVRLPADASAEQVDTAMAKAGEAYAALQKGADFADVAKQYSEDQSAASGGELGTFKKGEMLDEVEAQIVKLKPGQFSPPFRSAVGVHIVRLDESLGASHQSLDELAADIRERLYNEALEERYNRWLREDLRARHAVELRP
jgi:peptidyl-prolyl cis-trans isomerase SurA